MPVYGLNQTLGLVPYMGDKGDKSAARPPEGCPAEPGGLFGPESALGFDHPSRMPDGPAKRPIDADLLNTQLYKVRTKDKWSSALPNTSV